MARPPEQATSSSHPTCHVVVFALTTRIMSQERRVSQRKKKSAKMYATQCQYPRVHLVLDDPLTSKTILSLTQFLTLFDSSSEVDTTDSKRDEGGFTLISRIRHRSLGPS